MKRITQYGKRFWIVSTKKSYKYAYNYLYTKIKNFSEILFRMVGPKIIGPKCSNFCLVVSVWELVIKLNVVWFRHETFVSYEL